MKKSGTNINLEKFKYLVEESLMTYDGSSALRLSILGIPIVGTVIDTILTTKASSISYNRLLGFFNELDTEIKSINKKLINLDYLESESFYDLLLKTFEATLKTRHEEKRKLFAKVIKNSISSETVEVDPEFFISIVDELSLDEIIIAKELYTLKTTKKYEMLELKHKKDSQFVLTDSYILKKHGVKYDEPYIAFLLLRLEKHGLIKERSGGIGYVGGKYDMSNVMIQIMEFLEK